MSDLKNQKEVLLERVARLAKELKELKDQVDNIEEYLNPDYDPGPESAPPGSILDAIEGFSEVEEGIELTETLKQMTPRHVLLAYCFSANYGDLIKFLSSFWWNLKNSAVSPDFIDGMAYALQSTPIKFKSQNPNK